MQRALSTHLLIEHRLTTVWLERVWDAGIPLVEIFCARQHFDYHDTAQINELSYWFADAELRLHSVHAPMFTDDCNGKSGPAAVIDITETSKPRRLRWVDEIKRALDVAEKIPYRYLVQHVGVSGQEYDERRLDAAFAALEDLSLFAAHRGVRIALENIPNALSSSERLVQFLESTHLDVDFCLDTGHAHIMESVEEAYGNMSRRLKTTHVHDNNGVDDAHLCPVTAGGGSIAWRSVMALLGSHPEQYPLLLEIKDTGEWANPVDAAREVFEKLESL